MSAEQYRRLLEWFGRHAYVKNMVILADKLLPLVPFCCYPLLLALLLCGYLEQGKSAADILAAVFVPAAAFITVSLLRRALNRPRPYEQPGFVPLVQKSTRGQSFPSRHAVCAWVLAAVWLYFYSDAGVGMAALAAIICVLRVLTGVHFIKDVAAGAALGIAFGVIGMWMLL